MNKISAKHSKNHLKDRLLDFSQLRFILTQTMRYNDVGDYYGNIIVAFDTGDEVINNAIFIHEFIEYVLIKSAGIPPELIDLFDNNTSSHMLFPKEYTLYRNFHDAAVNLEKQFVENLGLDWESHEKIINTTSVEIAIEKATEELHKPHPSRKKIEETKMVVKKTLE